jgi:hypothetical protein
MSPKNSVYIKTPTMSYVWDGYKEEMRGEPGGRITLNSLERSLLAGVCSGTLTYFCGSLFGPMGMCVGSMLGGVLGYEITTNPRIATTPTTVKAGPRAPEITWREITNGYGLSGTRQINVQE